MRRSLQKAIFLGSFLGLSCAATAHATLITRTFDFSATGFYGGLGPEVPAPVDPLVGSFTVTFDPTLDVEGKTTGIVLHSLNLRFEGPISYSYQVGGEELSMGGPEIPAVGAPAGLDSFGVQIDNAATSDPFLQVANYSQVGTTYFTSTAGTVSVPEPTTASLFGFGLLGTSLIRAARRGKRSRERNC
jgi:hypothetical protein